MSENPFQSPTTDARIVGVRNGSPEELRKVAKYQRGLILCILIYVIGMVFQLALPPELRLIATGGLAILAVVSTVFVFLLSMNVYNTGLGFVLGILTLVPCLGLIVLLFVNVKATTILKSNGIRVGILGAKPSQI